MSGGPSIPVKGALLRIDHECPVSITALGDGGCTEQSNENSTTDITYPTTRSTTASSNSWITDNLVSPAIIGGVVVIVFIIALLVLALVVLGFVWKSCHGRKPAAEKTLE